MSRRLPRISGQDLVKLLTRELGYEVRNIHGSHANLRHAHRGPLTVPLHAELDRGLLRAIIRQAGLTREEFDRLRR